MMRRFAVIARLAAVGLVCVHGIACSGDRDAPASQPGETAAPAAGDEVHIRASDDTPFGQALAALVAITAPALGGVGACERYAASTRAFFASVDGQLGPLRERSADGVAPGALAELGAWLSEHARSLDLLAPAPDEDSGEIGRLHRELTAATMDLADALVRGHGAPSETGSASAVRIENAARNLESTLAALGALCAPL